MVKYLAKRKAMSKKALYIKDERDDLRNTQSASCLY